MIHLLFAVQLPGVHFMKILSLSNKNTLSFQIAFKGPPSQLNMKSRSRQFDNSLLPKTAKLQSYKGSIGLGKTNIKLRIVLWNVNGIRSVLSKGAMRDMVSQYFPDIICINETKVNEESYLKERIKMDGYFDYWNFCKCSAGYSGVAVFSKFQPISIFEDLDEKEHSQEGRVLTLQYQKFYLVVAYIPSAGDRELKRLEYKLKYEKVFYNHCNGLKAKGKGIIVCGDMNVSHEEVDIYFTPYAHKQPGFTPAERASFRKFIETGWVDTFRKLNPEVRQFTWWRTEYRNRERNIGRRLDYFIVNSTFFRAVTKSIILEHVQGSDHCPILLELNLSELKEEDSELKGDVKEPVSSELKKEEEGGGRRGVGSETEVGEGGELKAGSELKGSGGEEKHE